MSTTSCGTLGGKVFRRRYHRKVGVLPFNSNNLDGTWFCNYLRDAVRHIELLCSFMHASFMPHSNLLGVACQMSNDADSSRNVCYSDIKRP